MSVRYVRGESASDKCVTAASDDPCNGLIVQLSETHPMGRSKFLLPSRQVFHAAYGSQKPISDFDRLTIEGRRFIQLKMSLPPLLEYLPCLPSTSNALPSSKRMVNQSRLSPTTPYQTPPPSHPTNASSRWNTLGCVIRMSTLAMVTCH